MDLSFRRGRGQNTIDFIARLDQLISVLRSHRIYIKGYNENAIQAFQFLESSKQKKIISDLIEYTSVCSEATTSGLELKNTADFLRFTLKRMGMKAPEGMYSRIESGDIVEAYNVDQIQVFRSLAFLELCNYTLADVLMNQWYHLYGRDDEINEILKNDAHKTLSSDLELLPCSAPVHQMTEIFSEPRSRFEIKCKFFAPLFSGPENRTGFVCIIKARVLETTISTLKPRKENILQLLN